MSVVTKSILSLALLLSGSYSLADCLPGSQGADRILVHYRPGPNWSQIQTVMAGHLKFLKDQTAAQEIKFAGPVYAKNGDFEGGLVIFYSDSISHVESLLANDPALQSQAAVYEVETWGECAF